MSREGTGKADLVYLSHPEIEEPIHTFWERSRKFKRRVVEVEGDKPKNTGGKKPYVMLMEGQEAISSLSISACGFLYKLYNGGHIEWHTGRVIQKRSKAPLTQKSMAFCFGEGKKKIKEILAELTRAGVVKYDYKTKAYVLTRTIAKKGGRIGAD